MDWFHGLADISTIFQERIDTTLDNKHPAHGLDVIIVVTKRKKEILKNTEPKFDKQ